MPVHVQVVKARKIAKAILKTIDFVADVFTIVDQMILVPSSYIMCALANDLVRALIWRAWVILTWLLDLMSRHMLSYMPKITRILCHLAVLCDSLRCGAYGTFCYGISWNVIRPVILSSLGCTKAELISPEVQRRQSRLTFFF